MKKFLIAVLFLTGGGNIAFGGSFEIPMHIIDKEPAGDGSVLAPPRPWFITQDDNVLTLPELADDHTLELRDEYDAVVYSTFLPAGTTSVVLPSTLTGDFEIRLVANTYYYRGYINL